ncbi:hypothetical protein ACFQZ4_44615 [Catellatospora coxensis]
MAVPPAAGASARDGTVRRHRRATLCRHVVRTVHQRHAASPSRSSCRRSTACSRSTTVCSASGEEQRTRSSPRAVLSPAVSAVSRPASTTAASAVTVSCRVTAAVRVVTTEPPTTTSTSASYSQGMVKLRMLTSRRRPGWSRVSRAAVSSADLVRHAPTNMSETSMSSSSAIFVMTARARAAAGPAADRRPVPPRPGVPRPPPAPLPPGRACRG